MSMTDKKPQVTEKMLRAALVAQASSDGPPHLAMRAALLAAIHADCGTPMRTTSRASGLQGQEKEDG